MNKLAIAAALLVASFSASAMTVGPNCGLAWDYDPALEAQIDGFKVHVNDVAVAEVIDTERAVACSELGLTPGENVFEVTAYNAVGESPRSNSVTAVYVDSPPNAPVQLRLTLNLELNL